MPDALLPIPGRRGVCRILPIQDLLFLHGVAALGRGRVRDAARRGCGEANGGEVIGWMNQPRKAVGNLWKMGAFFLSMLMMVSLLGRTEALAGQMAPTVQVAAYPEKLVPVGHTVGLKLFAQGVLVVGLSELETPEGACTPAKDCGLKVGDVIVEAGGETIESTEQFQELVSASAGGELALEVDRDGKTLQLQAQGVETADGTVRLGAWIRDSLAGIGTMTFYDPANGVFGTLGHGINDTDTNLLMPLNVGAIMYSTVKAVKPGEAGDPGELRGEFCLQEDLGALYANTERGVFGTMESCALVEGQEAIAVATADEVTTGPAEILSNISGDAVERYAVEIERINSLSSPTQNFIVRVTDERLLEKTGGIVQGMSGSPIVQNGRLIGAVTHVMVNDPQRGYGIFIGRMLEDAYSICTGKAS